jgi:NAD(P)-dependent dehydrogenase (short-subunit alcohol dehydrogenase family)
MKVLVVGGYGVFGERLARLLLRDGHQVTVAGRDLAKAKALAAQLGCSAKQIDRKGDFAALAGHDVVVDAAGPFQMQGDDPWRLVRAAISARVHYIDLSDNADFCTGISVMDREAKAAGVCVISGLSTVPAISSAAVHALAEGEPPRVIDIAVLPGNRSPRGISVMTSILSQAGRPMPVWRGNQWVWATGWSDPARYCLPGGIVRQGWMITVPDLHLFPAHFGAETVLFRAGLELAVMRYGLAAFAALRRFVPVPVTPPVVRAFKWAADLLSPFGSGRGGMSVMVIAGGEWRWWRLLAEDGDGPFIPAVATRALLRRNTLPVGAAPALNTITLEEAESAMSDLRVRTEIAVEPFSPIFPQVLGPDFAALPDPVRATHLTASQSHWHGRAKVTRGKGLWGRFLCLLFRFPAQANDVPVEVIKTATPYGEVWQRRFGKQRFRSRLAAESGGITESFGPFVFLLSLTVQDRALHYSVVAGWLGRLPLPRWLLPVSQSREYVRDGSFHFDVMLLAPLTREVVVHYRGFLSEAQGGNPACVPPSPF